MTEKRPTLEDFDRVWQLEYSNRDRYTTVDAFERSQGFAIDLGRLENIAKTLACPVKVNPPNWQHGRIIYAIARRLQQERAGLDGIFLDIGTAKGFSAVCMAIARRDSGLTRAIVSIDKVDPLERVYRNSRLEAIAERPLTVYEFTEWIQPGPIAFMGGGSEIYFRQALTRRDSPRIMFAFVDGKHDFEVVRNEGHWLANFQVAGDVILFDDVQIKPVAEAVEVFGELHSQYHIEYLDLNPVANRRYALATRK